jgi:hypothetical protein
MVEFGLEVKMRWRRARFLLLCFATLEWSQMPKPAIVCKSSLYLAHESALGV